MAGAPLRVVDAPLYGSNLAQVVQPLQDEGGDLTATQVAAATGLSKDRASKLLAENRRRTRPT